MPPDDAHPSEADIAFMRLALVEAAAALERQEVPIGCVLVDEGGRVVAKGSNRTNEKRDATRHAELEAFDALRAEDAGREEGDAAVIVGNGGGASEGGEENGDGGRSCRGGAEGANGAAAAAAAAASFPSLPRSSLRGLTLFVTCEPCVMCAAALSILKPRRVVFGCHNPRFGGVGSVLNVVAGRFPGCGLRHEEGEGEEGEEDRRRSENGGEKSDAAKEEKTNFIRTRVEASFLVEDRGEKNQLSPSNDLLGTARPYRTLGGVLAAEAVALLKEFYETGNPSAPRPNRPAAAAATRAARKAAAAAAAAATAAAAAAAARGAAGAAGAAAAGNGGAAS